MTRQEGRPTSRGREIGVVVALTPSGRLSVRSPSERYPTEGTIVSDRTGAALGQVARVFGPVAQPYLSIRLRRPLRPHEAAGLIGSALWAGGP
ncbi:MAG TPA: H/ACA RNA-protein complex component Gar1 [Thermoplasmata archaeon]|nr:H/ACA RNA-protein complex component Gar1 [Thermoplasmata archaeon]